MTPGLIRPVPLQPLYATTRELQGRRDAVRAAMRPARRRLLDRFVRDLVAQRATRGALPVGATAPDFILPDVTGHPVRLYSILRRGPVALVFYRGGWCPYCEIYLHGLQLAVDRIRELGGELLAASPQLPDASLRTAGKGALTYPLLSDVGLKVIRRFGLVYPVPAAVVGAYRDLGVDLAESNGTTGTVELPLAATYIIDRNRTVHTAKIDEDPSHRFDPLDVMAVLAELSVRRRERDLHRRQSFMPSSILQPKHISP